MGATIATWLPAWSAARQSAISLLGNENRASTYEFIRKARLDFHKSIFIVVHEGAALQAQKVPNLRSGLDTSPSRSTASGRATRLSGSDEVLKELAKKIAALLKVSENVKLIVPHCYAKPSDRDRWPENLRSVLVVEGEEVNYLFDKHNSSADLISKALGSLITNDAVAWLVSTNAGETCPIGAFVKIFDGDGWLVFGDVLNSIA